jgi:hypothetical protein
MPAPELRPEPPLASARDAFERAVADHRRGALDAAIAGYLKVLAAAPDLVFVKDNLAQALLAAGDLERGFRMYETRFERTAGRVAKPAMPFPEWAGEDLRGRSILVVPEQGFGDQIMYARFVLDLADRGATVSMVAPPELAALFAHLPATIYAQRPGLTLPRADVWCMAGSLPARLGVTLGGLRAAPYLPSVEGGAGVGVVSQGRATPDPNRSLSAEAAAELMSWPGVVSLAPEDTGAADFEATRRRIESLACVVSIDTAVAHLAGAMGKPTFLMLPHLPDWRWMRDRADSPWYPSMRLIRQRAPGDWGSVLADVKRALGR